MCMCRYVCSVVLTVVVVVCVVRGVVGTEELQIPAARIECVSKECQSPLLESLPRPLCLINAANSKICMTT